MIMANPYRNLTEVSPKEMNEDEIPEEDLRILEMAFYHLGLNLSEEINKILKQDTENKKQKLLC